MTLSTSAPFEPLAAVAVVRRGRYLHLPNGVVYAPAVSRARPVFVDGIGYVTVEWAESMVNSLLGAIRLHERAVSGDGGEQPETL